MIITFALRFYKIQETLTNITEGKVNFLPKSVGANQENGEGFFELCEPGQQPCFNDYLVVLSLKLFCYKNVPPDIQFPNMLPSALIIPSYLILRKKLSIIADILATPLFTTSYWNLNFSRSS
jgi:hypothetical protein